MTAFSCHCEERSDEATSLFSYENGAQDAGTGPGTLASEKRH